MEGFFVIWILCGLIAAVIGEKKGEGCAAFFIGFLFGPFGILFALLSKGNRRTCPHCKELIHKDANVCPHCRMTLGGVAPSPQQVATIPAAAPKPKTPPLPRQVSSRSAPATHQPGIFLHLDGNVMGPFTTTQIEDYLQSGAATLDTLCCIEGSEQWQPLSSLVS